MDRPQPLPKGQRGLRANGEDQPRLTELTQRKKKHTGKHSHGLDIYKIQNCTVLRDFHRETFTLVFQSLTLKGLLNYITSC